MCEMENFHLQSMHADAGVHEGGNGKGIPQFFCPTFVHASLIQ